MATKRKKKIGWITAAVILTVAAIPEPVSEEYDESALYTGGRRQ